MKFFSNIHVILWQFTATPVSLHQYIIIIESSTDNVVTAEIVKYNINYYLLLIGEV